MLLPVKNTLKFDFKIFNIYNVWQIELSHVILLIKTVNLYFLKSKAIDYIKHKSLNIY
jgi:hypothetical protein